MPSFRFSCLAINPAHIIAAAVLVDESDEATSRGIVQNRRDTRAVSQALAPRHCAVRDRLRLSSVHIAHGCRPLRLPSTSDPHRSINLVSSPKPATIQSVRESLAQLKGKTIHTFLPSSSLSFSLSHLHHSNCRRIMFSVQHSDLADTIYITAAEC